MADFQTILEEHTERYPLMEPQDYCKLIFQSEFGPEHMITDRQAVRAFLAQELADIPGDSSPRAPEDIGGGICRFPLSACLSGGAADLLAELFALTGEECRGTMEGLKKKLAQAVESGIPGMEGWALGWAEKGCPPVHHSRRYNETYHTHYRLLRREYAGYFPALMEISRIMSEKAAAGDGAVIVAVDGRCGSGKTRFARLVSRLFSCNVFHMDDFYLPMSRREENWTELPGGNIDFERVRREVLFPCRAGEQVSYRPYCCQSGALEEVRLMPFRRLAVVEGSYSQHPLLAEQLRQKQYDLKIFLTCSEEKQTERLREREGSYFSMFRERWIPMEENYFKSFEVREHSEVVVDTGELF